jgi:hypothetical protein
MEKLRFMLLIRRFGIHSPRRSIKQKTSSYLTALAIVLFFFSVVAYNKKSEPAAGHKKGSSGSQKSMSARLS